MAHFQKLFVMLLLIFVAVYSQTDPQKYNQLTEYKLQPKGIKIEYSPNHQMLIQLVEGDDKLYVYSGLNYTFKNSISIQIQSDFPACLAFGLDNSFLIVGTKNGNLISYKIINNQLNQADIHKVNDQKKSIKSIVISTELQIAVGGEDNNIGFYKLIDGKFDSIKLVPYGKIFQCLAYNPDGSILLVGGIAFDQIQIKKQFKITQINSKTTHSVATYQNYFFQGTVTDIEVLNAADKTQAAIITFPNTTYLKVSQNGNYIVTGNGKNIKAWKKTIQNQKLVFKQFPLSSDATTTFFAATSNLQSMLISSNPISQLFQLFSLCNVKEFYTLQTNKCATCDKLCSICFQSSSKCYECNNNAFLKQTVCTPCESVIFNCITCKNQNDNVKCDSCKDQNNFSPIPAKNGSCVCKQSFYLEKGQQCLPCVESMEGCTKCDTKQICNLCDGSQKYILNPTTKKCDCQVGYYKDKTKKCSICPTSLIGCLECSTQTNCITCKSDQNFTQKAVDGKCICKDKYYRQDNKCILCSIQNCHTCSSGDGKTCETCEQGYRVSSDKTKCFKCDYGPGCIDCNEKQCTVCDDKEGHFNPTPVNGKCECSKEYYFKQSSCKLCQGITQQCLECLNDGSKCTKCKPEYYLKNQKCQLCQTGINGCLQCINDPDGNCKCIKCDTSKQFFVDPKDNKCYCSSSYYLNNKKQCQLCQKSQKLNECYLCSQDGEICQQCKKDSHRKVNQYKNCECEPFYYQDKLDKTCKQCDEFKICKQCDQQKKCSVCNQQNNWQLKKSECVCKQGYINIKGEQCEKCQKLGCVECQTLDKCKTCSQKDLFDPLPSEGQCKCVQNYVLKQQKCTACSSIIANCLTCSQSSCTKCFDTFVKANNNKSCVCPQNFELDGKKCIESSVLSPLLIAAIVVGGAVVLASIVIGVVVCYKKKKPKYQSVERDSKYDSLETS